jgi:UDP-N-acetylglucosamine/UDP-N-acetylgalactosamine diphosphorylase
MASSSSSSFEEIRARFESAGQAHVLDSLEDLSETDRAVLLTQLTEISVETLADLWNAAKQHDSAADDAPIEPFCGPIGRSTDESLRKNANAIGLEAVKKGRVAALVLAGGQGSRLGFAGPKGIYDIKLPSHRTLFQLISERLVKLSLLAGTADDTTIPFYIMTSPLNHDTTVAYFEQNNYFGLCKKNVMFFAQGMLPCLTNEGKIIMESNSTIAMAPDGNGGVYPALLKSGALDDMTSRGVQYLHVFSIDNALVRPADPILIGYCAQQNADCGNKVVWKAHAHEAVGVIASKAGRPCVVEYSEITTQMAEATTSNGECDDVLVYGAANICNHVYTLDFLRNVVVPNIKGSYHLAHKKIPYWDGTRTVTPTTNNGIKLETFIFDVFPLSERMAVLDVARAEIFAPVKNMAGSKSGDSPDTARQMISALSKKWLMDAGATLTGDTSDPAICEISPAASYAGEGLEAYNGKVVVCPFSI